MSSLIFVAALLSVGSALAETKVQEHKRTLSEIQTTVGAKEGSYEFSAQGADPSGLCENQVADLEWVQTGPSVTLAIGTRLSFSNLESDRSQDTDDEGCVSTDQNKIEKHKLIQTVENVCHDKAKAAQNYTNVHTLDFAGETIKYIYQHQEPGKKPVKTTCLMKYQGPKGSHQ